MTKNLTLEGAILLSGERRGAKRAQALRLFAGLMRQGAELPPEAVEFIAKSLEDHADTMPKSKPQGGTPKKAGMFYGLACQVIMQETGCSEAKAVAIIREYYAAKGVDAPSEKTIKRQRLPFHGYIIEDVDEIKSIKHLLERATFECI